jgi:tRNA nucleotidyltransferase (CCA-adding enzyme)
VTFLERLFPEPYRRDVYLVGGSVRDFLLGETIRDIDLTAALPEQVLNAAGFRPVAAKSSAPIWFRYDREFGKVEVTLLEHGGALRDDLRRRDFTVNAMAMDLAGTLHDPLGGRNDLRRRRLRVCGEESFVADPVRIFRAFRFECDGWRLDRQAQRLIASRGWGALLAPVPVERFSREMLDALGRKEPGRFFRRMREFGVGGEFLPELFRMAEVPAGPAEHHPEGDLAAHALEVLERVASVTDDVATRFCALFHDLGKLATAPDLYPRHHGHDEAGATMAKAFCDRLRLPARLRTALAGTCRLHTHANRWGELRDATKLRMAEQAVRAGIGAILPLVSAADKPDGAGMPGWREALAVAAMGTDELGIALDRLEAMQPEARTGYLLQKRIEAYREIVCPPAREPLDNDHANHTTDC